MKQANALLDPQSRVVKKEQSCELSLLEFDIRTHLFFWSANKPEPDDVSEDEDEATEKEKEVSQLEIIFNCANNFF